MIVFGLGNPGSQYERTRHNAGFMVVDKLAALEEVTFRKRCFRLIMQARKPGLTIVKPLTFMNRSGTAAKPYASKSEVKLIVCDNMDLPIGSLRIKFGGHTAGHKGLTDVTRFLGPDTIRVYLGVGRPDEGVSVPDHVLSRIPDDLFPLFEKAAEQGARAIMDLAEGKRLEAVQQQYNTRKE
ncbi:MAG: aminoacyl-tRNA hydrolase [Sphaerochaetaceae bacterium]|jgi:PTH1 family peptidyl-tRNA hydrolase|nr:aminoacyl-tRNA hydrolase [Sphaerochaetaceae bacterium]